MPCIGRSSLRDGPELSDRRHRGRGHYVGTVQSVVSVSDGWYGEGDDFFYIDGEKEPSLRGTGTEDYFCDGWGFCPQDGPYYGSFVGRLGEGRRSNLGLSLPHS